MSRAASYVVTNAIVLSILAAACYGQSDVHFALTRDAVRNTSGLQDLTVSGLGTVKGAALWSSFANANDVARSHALWSFGAGVSPTKRLAVAARFGSNRTFDIDGHRAAAIRMWMRSRPDSNFSDETADFSSLISDGVRINVTSNSPSNALLTTLLVGGTDANAGLVKVVTASLPGGTSDVALPFEPTCGVLFSDNDAFNDVGGHEGFAGQSIAFFTNDKAGNVAHAGQAISWRMTDSGVSTSYGQVSTAGLPMIDPTISTSAIDGLFTVSFPSPTTLRITSVAPTTDVGPAEIGVLLFDTGNLRAQVGVLSLPTSAGITTLDSSHFTPDVPFVPQAILASVNRLTQTDVFSGDSEAAGTWGLAGATEFAGNLAQYSTTVASKLGQTLSDSESLASDKFLNIQPHDGTANGRVLIDAVNFVYGGLKVNVLEAAPAALMLPYLAIESTELAGDYNNNSKVDIADYIVWRAHEGTDTELPNDPWGGQIGPQQYQQWSGNFGRSSDAVGNLAGDFVAIPEPSAWLLMVAACAVIIHLQRRG